MKIQIRRWIEIKNKEAFSEIYEIDENTIRNWVLNRVIVPDFSTSDEMKNWIMNINYLVESISGYPEFSNIDFERGGSVFYWSNKNNKLIINYSIEHPSQQINFNASFFEELKKHTSNDFKISIWDMESRKMIYSEYSNKELKYQTLTEDNFYNDVPYIQKLAKSKGLKKKKGKYDNDEIYDIIYELTDELLSSTSNTYLEIAPSWFK